MSELLYGGATFSQFLPGEFVNSHFLSSLQFFHFMDISDVSISKCFFLVEPILREVWPALLEILHTLNLRNPLPNDWTELVSEIRALPLSQFSQSWRHKFVIEVSDLYFSSPSSSTFDDKASISSDEFPRYTILFGFELIRLRYSQFVQTFQDIILQSPRVSAGTSLLSLSLLVRPILKFQSVRTAREEEEGDEGGITTTCREYTSTRDAKGCQTTWDQRWQHSHWPSPALDVQVTLQHERYCIEIKINALHIENTVSWVVISRGLDR